MQALLTSRLSTWSSSFSRIRHLPSIHHAILSSPTHDSTHRNSPSSSLAPPLSHSFSTKPTSKPIFPLPTIPTETIDRVSDLLTRTSTTLHSIHSYLSQTPHGRLMRLDKPIGTHLLFLPCAWGISLGATSITDFATLTPLFYVGAIVMRGAGCTADDILDKDIDEQVTRTQSRPLASGEISTPNAVVFLTAQLLGGLWVLTRLNTETFLLGTLSVLPAMFYPISKRRLQYPQAILGLTFNWGVIMGYCATTGSISPSALLLYGAGWCWTMVYDTIYAQQDKLDDRKLGIGNAALALEGRTKTTLMTLTAAKLALLTSAGLAADLSLPYFMGITASTLHLGRQVYTTDFKSPTQCQQAFESNQTTGIITWLSILTGRLF